MKFTIVLLFLGLLLAGCGSSSIIPKQEKSPVVLSENEASLIEKGIEYHDKGKYDKAINTYHEVIKINPDNIEALYELSYSYFANSNFDKSIEYALKGMEYDSKYLNKFYTLLGNSFDHAGKVEDAINVYKEGLKKFPDDYMICFNYGICNYNKQNYIEAEECFIKTIKINPEHASSHFNLGKLYNFQGKQVPAILHLLRFLTIEYNSERSKEALNLIDGLLSIGVEKKDEKNISINLFGFKEDGSPYPMIEMLLRFATANNLSKEKMAKSKVEKTKDVIVSLISIIAEQKGKKFNDFTAVYLFPFFTELKEKGFTEAFFYTSNLSNEDPEIENWMLKNKELVYKYADWKNEYKWKFE